MLYTGSSYQVSQDCSTLALNASFHCLWLLPKCKPFAIQFPAGNPKTKLNPIQILSDRTPGRCFISILNFRRKSLHQLVTPTQLIGGLLVSWSLSWWPDILPSNLHIPCRSMRRWQKEAWQSGDSVEICLPVMTRGSNSIFQRVFREVFQSVTCPKELQPYGRAAP